MNRSNSKKEATAAVYARLSRDDDLDGESNSIRSQRKKCAEVAAELGYINILHYVDDGISGMVEERPQFQKLIKDIKSGVIGAVICKDQSRLSRDMIVAQKFIELCVNYEDMRLVAISDGLDTKDRIERTFIGFRSIINESYAEDISKKCRMAVQTKGQSGAPIGRPPYGYEHNVSGKVSDERFAKLNAQYEQEQAELSEQADALQDEIRQEAEKAQAVDVFVEAVKKYSRIRKLTQQMLYDLVDRIEIPDAEKIDGVTVQHIDIHYLPSRYPTYCQYHKRMYRSALGKA